MTRRYYTINHWVAGRDATSYPSNARFRAQPEVLASILDARNVPWDAQEAMNRLLWRAQRDKTDRVHRSIRELAEEWHVPRNNLRRRLDTLQSLGLIRIDGRERHRVTIDLEPVRDLIRRHHRQGGVAVVAEEDEVPAEEASGAGAAAPPPQSSGLGPVGEEPPRDSPEHLAWQVRRLREQHVGANGRVGSAV